MEDVQYKCAQLQLDVETIKNLPSDQLPLVQDRYKSQIQQIETTLADTRREKVDALEEINKDIEHFKTEKVYSEYLKIEPKSAEEKLSLTVNEQAIKNQVDEFFTNIAKRKAAVSKDLDYQIENLQKDLDKVQEVAHLTRIIDYLDKKIEEKKKADQREKVLERERKKKEREAAKAAKAEQTKQKQKLKTQQQEETVDTFFRT